MHRLRTVRLAAFLAGLALVAAACGGGDDNGGNASGGGNAEVKAGGTLNYAADQEPTGFNNQPLGPEGDLAAAPRMLRGETLSRAGAGWGIFRGHPGWWRCRRRSRLLGTTPDFEEPT